MSRRFHPRRNPAGNLGMMGCALPWKLLLLLPILIVLLVPTYLFGTGVGGSMLSSLTDFFYTLAAPRASATPTPPPALPVVLPQAGSVLYTVREGDNCVAVLVFQMRMENASQVFSDAKPETVKALNTSFGEDCHRLQPGMVLPLSPHYPLVTLGGLVRKIEAATPRQVLPTPLIRVPNQQPNTADCSGGCLLTVQIAPQVQVRLHVRTTLSIRTGAWVWTRAMIARKTIRGFDNYPYADPHAPFNGMTLHACDFQVDDTHDDNGLSCRQLQPNTIDDDGGVWLLGVTGAAGLDHWRYQLRLPPNTRVLLWLTATSKGLEFKRGNPLYRYDNVKQVYVNV